MKIDGTASRGFERVAEAFERNFGERGEVGASVALTVGGQKVVDLWGGIADPRTNAPWNKDTVGIVFSCTKGATALCAHMLASLAEELTVGGGRFQAVEARSSVRERLRSEGVDARLGGIDRFTSVADALEGFLGST